MSTIKTFFKPRFVVSTAWFYEAGSTKKVFDARDYKNNAEARGIIDHSMLYFLRHGVADENYEENFSRCHPRVGQTDNHEDTS